MREQHVQMAFVHRDISRFTDGAARVVQIFGHIAQLHELLEIIHRGIAAAAISVAHERRAIDRRADKSIAADHDGFLRVAGVLGDGGRSRFAQLTRQATWDAHALAFDGRTGFAPAIQSRRVVDKVDTDFF